MLLKKPRWIFADEISSALDGPAEHTRYQRLSEMVRSRNGAMVSIAHRAAVGEFHTQRWTLVPEAEGAAARYRVEVAPADGVAA